VIRSSHSSHESHVSHVPAPDKLPPTVRIASVQANVIFNEPLANSRLAVSEIERLAGEGVELAVFPECFLTGYCVDSVGEARRIAVSREHPALEAVQIGADRAEVLVAIGFAEEDDDRLFNTVALFEPHEEPRYYRKTHLPELGFDKFASTGDKLELFETKLGRIGVLICFDQRFPEPARVLCLAGADLILLPTNWPEGAENSAEVMCIARAAENRVWFVTANRVGTENGFRFIGRSKIIGPTGNVVAAAGDGETTLIADIDLSQSRNKRTVNIPGKYEMEVFKPRRPELYKKLTD
jgi:predicted amidohydrolase